MHIGKSELINVMLDPHYFANINNASPLDVINDKWFVNLSHQDIPQQVQGLLQLGQNFSIPAMNMVQKITLLKLLKISKITL